MKKLIAFGTIALIAISLASPVQASIFSDIYDFFFESETSNENVIVGITSLSVAPGATVTVPIIVYNVTDLGAGTLTVAYDPSVCNVTGVTAGALPMLFKNISVSGLVRISALDTEGHSGDVVFANLEVEAVGGGVSSYLNISVDVLSTIIIVDGDPTEITNYSVSNGTFAILSSITTYGDGGCDMKTVYPDGRIDCTKGVRWFTRWDGVNRPWSELSLSSGDYFYLLEGDDATKNGVTIHLPSRNWLRWEHVLEGGKAKAKPIFTFSDLGFLVNNSEAFTQHQELGSGHYITLPWNANQVASFVSDAEIVIGDWRWSSDLVIHDANRRYFPPENYIVKINGATKEIRLYENNNSWFANAAYPVTCKFSSWTVNGSIGSAWTNVSHDNTTAMISTGNVELRREVDDEVSYWSFNEGTGNMAYDQNLTSENNGSFTDGSTGNWTASSKYGSYAIDFDGTDDYVDCGSDASLKPTDAITIVAWIYPIPTASNEAIVGFSGGIGWGYWFAIKDSTKDIYFYLDGIVNYITVTPNLYTFNEWNHMVATYDSAGGDNNLKLYVNGVLGESSTQTGTISYANSGDLTIGLAGGTYPFNGTIDEVRIYNRTLSNDEINQTMNNSHYSEGNLTPWYDAGSGNETYAFTVNSTNPSNTNYSAYYCDNATGNFVLLGSGYTGNNTITVSGTKYQNTDFRVQKFGNVTQTGETMFISFHTQSSAAADTSFTVTLPSGYSYAQFEPANSTAQNVNPNGQVSNNSIDKVPSDNLKHSDDDTVAGGWQTMTKTKTIAFSENVKGTLRIKFDLKSGSSGVNVHGRIYKNGAEIGSQQSSSSTTYSTKSQDIDIEALNPDDTIELWLQSTQIGITVNAENFRIYYDKAPDQEFYNVTNTGNVNLDIHLQLNETVADITLKADDNNTSSIGASTIETSLVSIYTGLTPSSHANIWLWSDFNHAIEQQTNKTLSINVTQS